MAAEIIIVQSIGQVGNRLEQFSHAIAFAREHGARVINPSFAIYSEFFRGTSEDLWCRYPARPSWVGRSKKARRVAYYALRCMAAARLLAFVPKSVWIEIHWSAGAYDLGNPQFLRFVREYRRIFLTGHWKHRYWGGYERHIEAIREHFRLVPGLEAKVEGALKRARARVDVLVGLHVRQGDNATDPVRRDAFSSEDYAGVARRIERLFPGRRVGFLLCSNKPQPMELYQGLSVELGPGDYILDMYSLAGCDYIVGAGQSSFSGWASLMGGKPRYRLFDPGREIHLEDFKVCTGVED